MADDLAARIEANPKYHKFVSTRSSYSIMMTILVMLIYYGYILLIAYDKEFLAQKMGAGMVTSIGIPMGVGVIVLTILITNIYVRRANSEFDRLNAEIIKEANQK
ncbi:DUF485 domain-containing protein [Propionivibrio sp.]|uniref:DUF485 domain-containing protein n=1 Tax=Propionivibrio sp. TaxID=2212460 RepID=UPI0025D6ACE7|nr:DUF485 domain-containing protein [Propionivibrio sp.]MBK7357248.1 DUF485 domain-containing protein [Propionivibrio sp.]MBK8401355.1 DUF485 domain-containing protein [Propionivibrio sp.]MBK8745975.1 DUF485 domain-containing protein [Propionivibrio sp.]MBK8892581.1 DUF485 domain-containing protein [Propionivibrio sp.]MBL0208708.1 DUF485 domain-containing protein [Propionivibrio sp.]